MALIVDAHEDIAWNILTFNRDYTTGVGSIREKELGTDAPLHNGNTLLGLEDWLAGGVGIVFATLFAAPDYLRRGDWDTQCYKNSQEAYRIARAQLDTYHRLTDSHEQFSLIANKDDLSGVIASWEESDDEDGRQIGLLTLMEGADPIVEPEQVEEWFESGVRIVGLSWERTRYAGGTHEPGDLTPAGKTLLELMSGLGMMLDLSHIAEEAYFKALDHFEGQVLVSHANPRVFCPTTRGLTDEMICAVAERQGVIGIVPYNRFLKPGWAKGDSRDEVGLDVVCEAIDYVCQVTGSANHVGLGSDFDGGFGLEHVPSGMDSVADLVKIRPVLNNMGYSASQIEAILGGNWLRLLQQALPE
nr:membrane dipeptidase [Anaerolineae bacterium]